MFLLGFSPLMLRQDTVFTFLNNSPDVHNWISLLPGQVFFVSDKTAAAVSDVFRQMFPDQFVFITEVSPFYCDGWLPQPIWNFISNPVSVKGADSVRSIVEKQLRFTDPTPGRGWQGPA